MCPLRGSTLEWPECLNDLNGTSVASRGLPLRAPTRTLLPSHRPSLAYPYTALDLII